MVTATKSDKKVTWFVNADGALSAKVGNAPVVWYPQPGSQEAFLRCPVTETLLFGNRGGGKSDCLIMDFCREIGRGFGEDWRGILFRHTYKELEDIIAKAQKWIPKIWPEAADGFNVQRHSWKWPSGEELLFRYMENERDFESYKGHNYTWIGWEELTTWPDLKCYKLMFSCLRSSHPGIPLRVRATTNPFGPGHSHVKKRFRLPLPSGRRVGDIITDSKDPDGNLEPPRVAIMSSLYENKILLFADPNYPQRVAAAARNPAERKAWLEDNAWDITSGGMFDDIWEQNIHVIPNVSAKALRQRGWTLNRVYDHGQSKPFAVLWIAESNGRPITVAGDRRIGGVRGDLIVFAEWYGFTGEPNEGVRMTASAIARGIIEHEKGMELWGFIRKGPADSQIFAKYDGDKSVAGDMAKEGIYWDDVDKSAGSRKQGWEQVRRLMLAAKPGPDGTREAAGLFFCERCPECIRTVPTLPRSTKDLDDVDSDAEDHIGDALRYRARWTRHIFRCRDW